MYVFSFYFLFIQISDNFEKLILALFQIYSKWRLYCRFTVVMTLQTFFSFATFSDVFSVNVCWQFKVLFLLYSKFSGLYCLPNSYGPVAWW